MPRALVSLVVCVAASAAAVDDASAIGFGRVRGGAVLGQPLDIAVPVRLDDGEALEEPCVAAEVLAGEQRVAPSLVRAALESIPGSHDRQVRVTTRTAIDEPVINITVSVGCSSRISRRFVAFADPPGASPVLIADAVDPAPPPVARPAPPTRVSTPAARRTTVAAASPAASSRARRAVGVRPAASAVSASKSAPRLQMEAVEPMPSAELAAAQERAAAAQAAASAASARLQTLEAELARLRADAQVQREALVQMRSRHAERDFASAIWPWLVVGMVALGATALWLWLRVRRLARSRPEPWWHSQQSMHAGESMYDSRLAPPAAVDTTESAAFDVASRAAPLDTAPGALQALAPQPPAAPTPPPVVSDRRAVTVEEQIDLEQQADFFIVLGQDDAAIELLLTHLRGTGGTSPMPYLKLLEIYRRTGDRDAYERTRLRFNQRFNAVAPAWGDELMIGRTLDDYPRVLQRLQHVWWSPLDAMADIEALLYRKGGDAELFDLPAYHEVLFLYLIARDLHLHERGRESPPPSDVDVLLPIDSQPGGLSVRHVDMGSAQALRQRAERAAEDLDIDLTEAGLDSRPIVEAVSAQRSSDSRLLDFEDSVPPR